MARSEEAILRRALKRQRTEEEQRKIDRKDMEVTKRRKQPKGGNDDASGGDSDNKQKETDKKKPDDDPLKEAGAWKCPNCLNENFASRWVCNSKTCDQRRPDDIPPPPTFRGREPQQQQGQKSYESGFNHPMDEEGAWTCASCQYRNFSSRDVCNGNGCHEKRPDHLPRPTRTSNPSRRQRHDPETSKELVWSKQADKVTLSKNQELRKHYQETGGEGMASEDVERAKVLIERDERKRQKRLQKYEEKVRVVTDGTNNGAGHVAGAIQDGAHKTEIDPSSATKSQKAQNKRLRKRYLATGGKGMTDQELERAKILIARDERKRAKRAVITQKIEER